MARSAFDPVAKVTGQAAHSVSKSRRQDTTAGVAGAAVGARTAPSLHQRAQVRSAASHFVASQERERAAATVGIGRRHRSLLGDEATRRWHRGYQAAKRARSTPLRLAAGAAGAAAGGTGAVAASRAASRRRVHKSAFGAELVLKSDRRDAVAAAAGAGAGGVVGARAHGRVHLASADKQLRLADAHIASTGNASPEGQEYHFDTALKHNRAAKVAVRRFRSRPLLAASGLAGAALGAAGAAGASRATSRRPVTKSVFGVEHPVSKGVPTPARLRVVGPKPGQPVTPPQGAAPRPPLTQRLNNAVTATGGSSS